MQCSVICFCHFIPPLIARLMAEVRLSKLTKQYSIGLARLVEFLNERGANVEMNPNAKVSDEFIPALEEKFGDHVRLMRDSEKVTIRLREIIEMGKQKRAEEEARQSSFQTKTEVRDSYTAEPREIKLEVDQLAGPKIIDKIDLSQFDKKKIVTISKKIVSSISFPGGIITEPFENYKKGILLPQHITSGGSPVSMAWLKKHVSRFKVGDVLNADVIQEYSTGSVAFLTLDIGKPNESLDAVYSTLQIGLRYFVRKVEETLNYYFVEVADFFFKGVILKKQYEDDPWKDSSYIEVQLTDKGTSSLELLYFCKPVDDEDINAETDLDKLVSGLLNEYELEVIEEKDLEIVKQLLLTAPSINRNNKGQLSEEVYCRIPEDSPMTLYLKTHPGYLADQTFWLNAYYNKEVGETRLVLFQTEPTIFIELEPIDDYLFKVAKFESNLGNETRKSVRRNNRYATLMISSSNLHFLTRYEAVPSSFRTSRVIDIVNKLIDYNNRIQKSIADKLTDRTKNNAKDYTTLTRYLKYQREKELERSDEVISISKGQISLAAGTNIGGATALKIDILPDQLDVLMGDLDESVNNIHVSILDGNEDELYNAQVQSNGIDYHLQFNHGHIELDSLLEGFYIKRRVNTKHLEIQIRALEGFVQRDSLSIYQDLISNKLAPTNELAYKGLKFINPIFEKATDDNHQPDAVRKALGNENVVLIQGPPGTGKTTIIVEIINQLVKEGKKVLVCSQAHAAVANIYDRLDTKSIDVLRIDDQGEIENVSKDFDSKVYSLFLDNNESLINDLYFGKGVEEISRQIDSYKYANDETTSKYQKCHKHIQTYFVDQKGINPKDIANLVDELKEDTTYITGLMLATQMYRSKDVVMGTCIGVGMNKVLKEKAVRFDTVIIDEAGKANLAETIVPMQLGNRYILVGDHKQLPPFIDRQEIQDYANYGIGQKGKDQSDEEYDVNEIVNALSNSLFADFYDHPCFPPENKVTLNYQFRMNPEIGQYISDLFYQGVLQSGPGTEKQTISIDGYPSAVTFVDTTTKKLNVENDPRETSIDNGSIYNQREIAIICDDILPVVSSTIECNPELKLGIITPYKLQYFKLKEHLRGTPYEKCVFTIDSIQGSEFDIVIFSFVRSFSKASNKTVGFLDDMRRLNVSLSRAKKKLILVGNLNTLSRPEAHNDYKIPGMVSPVEVFNSIATNVMRIGDLTDVERFLRKNLPAGTIFENCPCTTTDKAIVFQLDLDGDIVAFALPKFTEKPLSTLDIIYKGLNPVSGKPIWRAYNKEYHQFAQGHKSGDIVSCTIKLDGSHVYMCVGGVSRPLSSKVTSFCQFVNEEHVDVKIQLDDEHERINFILTQSALIQHSTKNSYFDGEILSVLEFPKVDVKLEDDSTMVVENNLLWQIADVGEVYKLLRLANGVTVLNQEYFKNFKATLKVGHVIDGEVFSEDERYFYIKSDNRIYGVISKAFLVDKRVDLNIGSKHRFRIYRFDEIHKIIILSI